MFKPLKCPNCGIDIDKLEFSPDVKRAKWYKLVRVEHVCPYCREGVEYDKQSQRKGFIVFIFLAIPSVLAFSFAEEEAAKVGSFLLFLSTVVGVMVFLKYVKLVAKK